MDGELLKAVAKAVLTQLEGRGFWSKYDSPPRWSKIDNPLAGLKCGDMVFVYDESDEEICAAEVAVVIDEIGYAVWMDELHGPVLLPVSADVYSKTEAGAAEASRDSIESDFEYTHARYEQLVKAKSLLA